VLILNETKYSKSSPKDGDYSRLIPIGLISNGLD